MMSRSGEKSDDLPEDRPLEEITKATDEAASTPGEGDQQASSDSKDEEGEDLPEDALKTGQPEEGGATGVEPLRKDEQPASSAAPASSMSTTDPFLIGNAAGGWYTPDEELEPPAPPPPTPQGFTQLAAPPPDLSDTQPVRPSRTPPPPPKDATPSSARPRLDSQGIPLPRRVDEIDMDATRVTPSAYRTPVSRRVPPPAPVYPTVAPALAAAPAAPRQRESSDWQRTLGCLLRLVIAGLFLMVAVSLLGISFLLFQYYRIAATLPSVQDLRQRAAQFETTRILDRNGNTLYEILDPSAGRRTYVRLDKISPYLVAATVVTEDKEFYSHPGFDITAIGRAFLQNYRSGETVSGASTITQQLARSLLFTPEERSEQSYMRKVREAILAAEITRRYTKDEILELYLNEFNYGNLAYGVEAAAQTYFRTSAGQLTLGQAAFLAGLPQAPSV